MMPTRAEEFMTLFKEGKIKEARVMLETETEKLNSGYAPDTTNNVENKPPRFTKKGKPVERGDDGKWRLKG
jgi:hypothetical protein